MKNISEERQIQLLKENNGNYCTVTNIQEGTLIKVRDKKDFELYDITNRKLFEMYPFWSSDIFNTVADLKKVMDTDSFKEIQTMYQAMGVDVEDYRLTAIKAGAKELGIILPNQEQKEEQSFSMK